MINAICWRLRVSLAGGLPSKCSPGTQEPRRFVEQMFPGSQAGFGALR